MYQPPTTAVPVDPIIARLRPRTVPEVLDHAFRLYRKHFLTFVAVIAMVHVPLQLLVLVGTLALLGDVSSIQAELVRRDLSSARANEIFVYLLVAFGVIMGLSILAGLVQKLSEGALTAAVADSHLDRPVTFGSAYRQMLRQVGPLLGLIFLEIIIRLAVFLPIIVLFFIAFGMAIGDSTAGAGFGLICVACLLFIPAIVALIYLGVRLTVTTPALIVEKLGPMQAISRSWSLVSNYWWRTLAFQAVLLLLGLVVQVGPGALVSALAEGLAPDDFVLQQVLTTFVTTLTTLLYLPLQLIAVTLYYFDLRVRKEGYDLETAMSQRYAPLTSTPGWGGDYGGGYGQPQPAQTPPVSGYAPPQLGGESQGQPYGYSRYNPTSQQPSTQTYSVDSTPPTLPSPPETPHPPHTEEQT